jgi:predicted amidohydrolase
MANLEIVLDQTVIVDEKNLNLLPEMGAFLSFEAVKIERFVHRGEPRKIPNPLHLGGWQVLNTDSIEKNTESILRGIKTASERGIDLLVTPETCLTGLYPAAPVTQNKGAIAEAEKRIRKALRQTPRAPCLVVGLPVWKKVAGHEKSMTRFNVSRVYEPDGHILGTHAKVHSCEPDFWHGYRLQEFEVKGVPVCMHICHDGRYPELWTLPVMFGARVILHPANGGTVSGSIDAFEMVARQQVTRSAHAFYIHVNGGGGSFISVPQKPEKLLAVSEECSRNSPSFPMVGTPRECLIDATINSEEAYGYWPVRSFRASEDVADAYCRLYRAMGGKREIP